MVHYSAGPNDRVVPLEGLPPCEVGAPLPAVVAAEHLLLLSYWVEEDVIWNGRLLKPTQPYSGGLLALVEWHRPYAHYLGPPNEEAIAGHPLSGRGIYPCQAFEVTPSSWRAELERRNEVHPYHRPEPFRDLRHFIYVFHDSTFECLAQSFTADVHEVSEQQMCRLMLQRLSQGAPDEPPQVE